MAQRGGIPQQLQQVFIFGMVGGPGGQGGADSPRCPLSRPKQTATQAVSHSLSCDQKHMRQAGRATEAQGVKTVWGLLSRSGVIMLSRPLSLPRLLLTSLSQQPDVALIRKQIRIEFDSQQRRRIFEAASVY